MIDHLRALAVFAKAVEHGTFRAAARALQLSPSVVSHHVAQLEGAFGVALLYRSTRRLTLTDDGRRLFAAAREMVAAAELGLQGIASKAEDPSGHLKIAAPAGLVAGPLLDDLAAFATAHRRVAMTMCFSDAPIDLIGEGVDVAFRGGSLKDSSLKSKRLFDFPRTLVAAPAYAAARPAPRHPRDLAGWDWIRLASRPPAAQFGGPGGRAAEVAFSSRLTVDNAEAMLRLAAHGLGVTIVPSAVAERELRAGRVVEILPEWRPLAPTVYAVWPANAPRGGLAMRLVAFLEKRRPR